MKPELPQIVFAEQRVTVVASTQFHPDTEIYPLISGDYDEISDGAKAAEVGGRICYDSFGKEFSKRDNADYMENILKQGHGSVLEHANFSLLISGVSRNLTHEMIRHRHLSPSQRSQRYCNEDEARFVMPPLLRDLPEDHPLVLAFVAQCGASLLGYRSMVKGLQAQLGADPKDRDARKKINQTARYCLSSAVETELLMTGNVRAWSHFLTLRGAAGADAEIRELAVNCYKALQPIAVPLFDNFELVGDGIVNKYPKV
jgi:thymidylate synthase (FAD)